ncbi:MAG: YggT family protein [Deltaproteobacteria bacterium]|uniref:YggT family protein n=1 Tax=Candidatus Acidulodesulfobacterium acidiphilum TaxID=2597224 RepID=A0A520XBM9_9DELT|nr:YggT family protein [Deltaproteobacteria bacterium]MCL6120394.1 YggT family protein [Deltaproteobacteria bacterium]MDA8299394.1 YggT family protein [Deltaproteobacteria bacterium]RZV38525.1 MAG: YggT family protein [Candidatus Acidulodesulfobacterium acidiphilum]
MDILLLKFLTDVIDVAKDILYIYMWVIIIKALLSWVNPDPYNPIVRFINDITEPVLNKVRLILPVGSSFAFDLSPLIVILIIIALTQLLNFIEYRYIMQNIPFIILRR